MAKQGRPVGRNPQYRDGRISPYRVAWAETFVGQFLLLGYPVGYDGDNEDLAPAIRAEPGPSIRLQIINKHGRPTSYNLTALRADELRNLREVLNMAFDLAEPICELRDKAAEDAYENGNDTFSRIYRQVRDVVVREGAIREHSLRLQDGPEDVPEGSGSDGTPEGRVRGGGGELADVEPEDRVGQDDGSEDDER